MEALRVTDWRFTSKRPLVAQDQGEAISVGHDSYGIAFTVHRAEIEEASKELLRLVEVVYTQVNVI
jgi:hypothetical protein